jgi:hypothetical protein
VEVRRFPRVMTVRCKIVEDGVMQNRSSTVVVPEGDRSAMLLQGRIPPLGPERHGPRLVYTSDLSQSLSTCQLATKNNNHTTVKCAANHRQEHAEGSNGKIWQHERDRFKYK